VVVRTRLRLPVHFAPPRLPRLPARPSLAVLAVRLAPSWRSLLVAVVLVLAACGGYVLARETSIFAVRTIRVQGAPAPIAAQVRHALEPLVGTSLLEIERDRIERELGRLPAVAAASYNREFPHTLKVYVRAERPLAVLRQAAEGWLVAADGRVIRRLDHPGLSRLPRIWLSRAAEVTVGSTVGDEEGAPAVAALAPLRDAPLRSGVRDVVTGEHGLTLVLRSGIEVRLGDASNARLKLTIARRILPSVTAPGYLDVSVPSRAIAAADTQLSG
jgi:cell division protein FtsQ